MSEMQQATQGARPTNIFEVTPLHLTDWHGEGDLIGIAAGDFKSRDEAIDAGLHRDHFSRAELAPMWDAIIATDATETELAWPLEMGLQPVPGIDVDLLRDCIAMSGVHNDAMPQLRARELAEHLQQLAEWRGQVIQQQAKLRELAGVLQRLPDETQQVEIAVEKVPSAQRSNVFIKPLRHVSQNDFSRILARVGVTHG